MRKKWDHINDVIEAIDEDSTLMEDGLVPGLKCLTYAPNIGYRTWIFKYKGTLMALWYQGNCHWVFHSAVSVLDLIVAKLTVFLDSKCNKKG